MNITLFLSFFACNDSTTESTQMTDGKEATPAVKTVEKPKDLPVKKVETTKQPEKVKVKGKKGMPDLLVGLDKGGCDNGPGVYGAADYFLNTFTISGNQVSGTEKWLLFPNKKLSEKWSSQGIKGSCEVTWNLTGSLSGELMKLENQFIKSNCPKEIVNKYTDSGKSIVYMVNKKSNGTASFSFRSGKQVGEGHHQGNSLQFITNRSCRWF